MLSKKYVIVFDLDETLGHFSQAFRFWDLLKIYLNNNNLHENNLFKLFDLFPEFFRTDIFKLLKLIKYKKQKKICDKVMIYTNNCGPNNWVSLIKDYIHKKINYNLFDQIIRAFKINGKHIELCRTSYNKTHRDFINCTKLPENTEICFIDDNYHHKMQHENVLYINVKPYYNIFDYKFMCKKYYNNNKNLFKTHYNEFENFIINNTYYDDYTKLYVEKSTVEKNIEFLITQKMIKEIKLFLSQNKKYTRKHKLYNNNKTRKN